jgi:hypothetical protein
MEADVRSFASFERAVLALTAALAVTAIPRIGLWIRFRRPVIKKVEAPETFSAP